MIRYTYIRKDGDPQAVCIAYRFEETSMGCFQISYGVSTNYARWRVTDGQRHLEGDVFLKSEARSLASNEIPEIPQITFTGVYGKPDGMEFTFGAKTLTLHEYKNIRFYNTAMELAVDLVMQKLASKRHAAQAVMGKSGRPLMKKPRVMIRRHLTTGTQLFDSLFDEAEAKKVQ